MTDPLEGFQLINFDEGTGTATIAISAAILGAASQDEALTQRAIDVISHDNGITVKTVVFVAREADDETSSKGETT